MSRPLQRTITVPQGVALYVGAVVGAGVLLLPALSATRAGPAAISAWLFDSLLGIPLALTFAAMAARQPDAGGVSTYVRAAYGPAAGTVIGWFYFFAAASGQALVALTGAYYAAPHLGLDRGGTFLLAGVVVAVATGANLQGLRVSARLQLAFSGVVVLVLLASLVVSVPRFEADNWTPFAPHGFNEIGSVAVLIFFAFFGWEAISHLSEEFRDPARDVPRSTIIAVGVITVVFAGVVVATISTATYGTDEVNRTVIARLLSNGTGDTIGTLTAAIALLVSIGTANAFLAGTSRLGYALARDGVFPEPLARVSDRGVPRIAVWVVGSIPGLLVLVSYLADWGPEALLDVPNSLVIIVYLGAMAAGVRLLTGGRRVLAAVAAAMCLILVPFSGAVLFIPVGIALAALAYRHWFGRPPSQEQAGQLAAGSDAGAGAAETGAETGRAGVAEVAPPADPAASAAQHSASKPEV